MNVNPAIILDDDSISLHTLETLGFLLYYSIKPRIIVEAGTYKGSFAITAAMTCPDAHVYTADAVDHNWGRLITKNGVEGRVTFVNADFEEIAARYPELVGQVDVAFIDSGWPMVGYEAGMRERHFRAAQRWVKPGGYVFVDDLGARDWTGAQAIADACCLVLPTDRGLGVWRRHT